MPSKKDLLKRRRELRKKVLGTVDNARQRIYTIATRIKREARKALLSGSNENSET